MRYILNHLISALEQGQSAVLAAIVRSSGSAPRTSGARMLMLADGTPTGSIGGGALEGACQAQAKELFLGSCSFVELNFELNASSAADAGMLCGGSVSVLLHRVDPISLELFRQVRDEYVQGLRPMLLTLLPSDSKPPRLAYLGRQENGNLPAELRAEILRKNRRVPLLVNSGDQEVFVEPLVHPGIVHLVGAGHVALATAQLAAFVGFEVVVMDDRVDFANMARYPQAREIRVLDSFDNCLDELGPDDYVVIVTRGHMHDREVLAQALRTPAGYVGMIGSRRKRDAIYGSLHNEGFTDADLSRVHCPIGLAIGADTPEEIALSIVTELVQVRAGMSA
jgi:xanthine dehydrogenase accessory factor